MKKILVVDDEKNIGKAFVQLLKRDYEVEVNLSGEDALKRLDGYRPDIVFLDINMPGMDGIETLRELVKKPDHSPVVMMTAYGTIETAVEAMKLGAADYIQKPFSNDEVKLLIRKILELNCLKREVAYYRASSQTEFSFDQIVGVGEELEKVKEIARRVAPTESTVFIRGESGTGKELLARAIHYSSHRRHGPFVAVNCAAIPEEIIESELFGHRKGSFTGAIEDRTGKFRSADDGTIFLDEVGDMSLKVQAKILRVLEERMVTPVGGTEAHEINVRVIAATNQDVEEMVKKGGFREDLYYRLNVVPLHVPPLRQRREDIPSLAEHFIRRFTHGDTKVTISKALINRLAEYDWPGNIRELRNAIER
ncbi:MAG: sigma-54-dependent Fis family transcriptional regulator, partial [Candidatus Abyssobacteria bacterium SURF_17]